MKRFVALLSVLTLISGCDWFTTPAVPVPPEAPPKTHVEKKEKVTDKVETLHFFATWCGPCAMQKPVVEALKVEGYNITDDNVDDKDSQSNDYNIHSVPTYVVLVNGKEKYRTQSAMELGSWLRQHDVSKVQKRKGQVRNLSNSPGVGT